tara:strand:+ start:587 stop:1471 length:885 start_codon:yes stop_codon:yes gene_type:complete
MKQNRFLIFLAVLIVLALGVGRKLLAQGQGEIEPGVAGAGRSRPVEAMGASNVAAIAKHIERVLGEHIIQVFGVSSGDGVEYTFDLMTFNKGTSQASTKRVRCTWTSGQLKILSQTPISPITGAMQGEDRSSLHSAADFIANRVGAFDGDDDDSGEDDAKFVRDTYAFVSRSTPEGSLPAEPKKVKDHCLTSNDPACMRERRVYETALQEYKRQMEDIRINGSFARPSVDFAPTNETVDEASKFPFGSVRSYGYGEHVQAPLDLSSLDLITPLKDEAFFNAVQLGKSTLAIQYP